MKIDKKCILHPKKVFRGITTTLKRALILTYLSHYLPLKTIQMFTNIITLTQPSKVP